MAPTWRRADSKKVSLLFGWLEHYLDLIEVSEQLARERRHCAIVAYRGGVLERAPQLRHRIESVAAPFTLDAMRDAADCRIVAPRHCLENAIDVGAFMRQKVRNQIAP